MKHVAVVGASLAGLGAARALRAQGFEGRLTIVGEEVHRPYDRPPLSKELLAGTVSVAELALERDGEDLAAQWRLGTRAARLRPRGLDLADGTGLTVDGVVLATGATARRLGASMPTGVHTLRTLDDALALRTAITPGVRVVVIGAGFIGSEVASTAARLGAGVTVLEAAPSPLAGPLGPAMGRHVAGLHERNGVALHCGVAVVALRGAERVTAVALADGRELPADVVVVGVGARPAIDWLRDSGIALGDGVLCDRVGQTSLPGVVAVGDCAAWQHPRLGLHHRTEHWTAARDRAAIAVSTLLGRPPARPERAPYFWSEQYGVRLQFAGEAATGDQVDVVAGDPAAGSFLAVYRRGGDPVAVLGVDREREFSRWRRELERQTP